MLKTSREAVYSAVGVMFFTCFGAIQLGTVLAKDSLYPFQSYRMYSDHWKDGSGFIRITYKDDKGGRLRTWDAINVPFFQANQISFRFLDKDLDEQQKNEICQYVARSNGLGTVSAVYDETYFQRSLEGSMIETRKNERVLFSCSIGGQDAKS